MNTGVPIQDRLPIFITAGKLPEKCQRGEDDRNTSAADASPV
jgi:hypothetical protein